MLNCKETAELISRRLDQRLSRWQRLNLRVHLMMCGGCSIYKHQIETLHQLFREHFSASQAGEPSLPDEARRRIKQRLRDEAQHPC